MKLIERVFYSISGKKIRTLLFLFTVILLGTFLSASFFVFQVNHSLENTIKERLNPIVLIEWKYESRSESNKNYDNEDLQEIEKKEISEKLKNDERIKIIENRFFLQSLGHIKINFLSEKGQRLSFGFKGAIPVFNQDQLVDTILTKGNFELLGLDNCNVADITNENLKLISGRTFSEEEIENGENVFFFVTDYEPYEQYLDELFESDIFYITIDSIYLIDSFSHAYSPYIMNVDYKIMMKRIGVATPYEKGKKYHLNNELSFGNYIYIPEKLMHKISNDIYQMIDDAAKSSTILKETPLYQYEGMEYLSSTYIELNDFDDLDSFIHDMKRNYGELIKKCYSFSDSYNDIQFIMLNLNFIAFVSLLVSAIASIILLSLFIRVMIQERKHEIGIYLALGESKKRVLKQILLEILLVGFIGISISVYTGSLLGNPLSKSLLEKAMKQQDTVNELLPDSTNYELSEEKIIEAYQVEITKEYVICVYAGGMVVLLLSCIYPMKGIMKMKVKKMLM